MSKNRSFHRIITIVLLVSIILCFCYAMIYIRHDCTHDDSCFVCSLIHQFQNNSNGFVSKFFEIIVVLFLLFAPLSFYINSDIKNTLISLKVELIN